MASRRKRPRLSENRAAAVTTSHHDNNVREPVEADQSQEPAPPASAPLPRISSLFVRALPLTVSTEDLTRFFSQSFPVKHALVVQEKGTGKSKGFGFVTFADADDAERAKGEFQGSSLQGNKLQLSFAKPRQRHSRDEAEPPSTDQGPEQLTQARTEPARHGRSPDSFVRLIVRNLPWSITEPKQLARLFLSYGKVKYATLPKCKPGLSPGFGFVVLRGEKNVEKALAKVNGKILDGRALAVDRAVDKNTWQAQQHEQPIESDRSSSAGESKKRLVHRGSRNGSADEETKPSNSEASSDAESGVWESNSSGDDDASEASHGPRTRVPRDDMSGTLFVRNLPFTATDAALFDHFDYHFGPLRYARIVVDQETDRPKGTGFVCFCHEADAWNCLREAPNARQQGEDRAEKGAKASTGTSILQDMTIDPYGRFTVQDRVLQISQAVGKDEAHRITTQRKATNAEQDKDKRHLFLLSEGSIPSGSPLHAALSPSEIRMREQNMKQRQMTVRNNPSLFLSLTRLSIRNLARQTTAKDLKALARQAVVGFAKDVKEGRREPLSKEEAHRDREQMKEAERARRLKAKGIVKQAKIVLEGNADKLGKEDGAEGQCRGFGFIEYSSHRWALMALRWLNGYRVEGPTIPKGKGKSDQTSQAKRLVVEFAIENARVVAQRRGRVPQAQETVKLPQGRGTARQEPPRKDQRAGQHTVRGRKTQPPNSSQPQTDSVPPAVTKTPLALQQIIGRKRARKGKRGSA